MRCTIECPGRGHCPQELRAETCEVYRANSRRGHELAKGRSKDAATRARKADAERPIPQAVYMQRAEQAAKSLPPWYAELFLASRREAYGIKPL